MTKEEVKSLLQIKTTNHDDYLTTIIPLLIDWIKEYTNNSFETDGMEEFPGGVRIFLAKACEYLMNKAGVNSRGMGAVSYSFEMDFPPGMLKLIKPYKKVRFS